MSEGINLQQHLKPDHQLELENIWRLSLISDDGSAQAVTVELRDANSRNVPFTYQGVKTGAAVVEVSGAASILFLLKGAGYNSVTNGIPPTVVGDGPPVYLKVRLDPTTQGSVSYNLSGDPSGGSAATSGISSRYGAPIQNGCNFLEAGETIQVGLGWAG